MKPLKLTDREIQLLARLSRDRRLYAECKGADLDALQELDLLHWFDARSSTTPFQEDLRPLLTLWGVGGRIDYAWVAAAETGASLSGEESLRRWTRSTNSQTVKLSSCVVENEGPTPKSIGRHHATSAPAPAAYQGLTVLCLDRCGRGRRLWAYDRHIRWRAAARLWRPAAWRTHQSGDQRRFVFLRTGLGVTRDGTTARAAVPAASRHKDGLLSPYCFGRSCHGTRAVSWAGRGSGRGANSASGCAVLLRGSFSHKFIDDINHLLGQNVLLNFITGHYYRPRLEQRVFLFIDIEGSTTLAERLGEFAFHRLISHFVVDITEPIVAAYGEIHRYVGDELIATWKLADGIANAHCVRACFDAFDRLAALSPVYVRDFGTPVHCRAGLHSVR